MTQTTRRRRRNVQADKHGKRAAVLSGVLVAFAAIAVAVLLALAFVASTWLRDLPSVDNLDEYAQSGSTTIYANDGETKLAEIYTEDRIQVSLDEISDYVKEGTIATEDERFYNHGGFDMMGIARAAFVNITGQGSEGASTLTQQLVRNTVLLDEMTDISVKRKVREIYLAVQMEQRYSKDEILNYYLNIVNYGNNCYGIEAAARNYFGIGADELTLSQAALLVGIPNSPNAYEPREHYDAAIERRNVVLSRMLSNGCITQEEYDEALADRPEVLESNGLHGDVDDIAPYFVDYVNSLMKTEGYITETERHRGGISIYTTLDPSCQSAANDAVQSVMADSDLDAALASVDPDNGHIVAMVGGKDYASEPFNLATQMSRQPGSTFKPFALAAALEQGISPQTKFDATSPAKITKDWTVNNSEGDGKGYTTLEKATWNSLNTVYAHLTHDMIGAQSIVDMAHRCGIESDLNAVESICLGTQGVNALEMASAYATFANDGVRHEPVAVLKVVDSEGEVLYEHVDDEGEQVISPALAEEVTRILQGVITSGTGTGARQSSGQAVAGKTGTSEEGRDLWFCGYSPQYSTAVWTGYRSDTPTPLYGSTTSTPIWDRYMEAVLEGTELEAFPSGGGELIYTDFDPLEGQTDEDVKKIKEELEEEMADELEKIEKEAEEEETDKLASAMQGQASTGYRNSGNAAVRQE